MQQSGKYIINAQCLLMNREDRFCVLRAILTSDSLAVDQCGTQLAHVHGADQNLCGF